jgi:hypothetical protein
MFEPPNYAFCPCIRHWLQWMNLRSTDTNKHDKQQFYTYFQEYSPVMVITDKHKHFKVSSSFNNVSFALLITNQARRLFFLSAT